MKDCLRIARHSTDLPSANVNTQPILCHQAPAICLGDMWLYKCVLSFQVKPSPQQISTGTLLFLQPNQHHQSAVRQKLNKNEQKLR